MTAETANTPVKRLYFCIQMMYLKNDIPRYRTSYLGFLKDLREALPGSREQIDAANAHVCERCSLQGAQGNQKADEARRRASGGLTRLKPALATCAMDVAVRPRGCLIEILA